MADRTDAEAEKSYIEKMGEALGKQFHALWKEVVWLHWNWAEYVELFADQLTIAAGITAIARSRVSTMRSISPQLARRHEARAMPFLRFA
jgi:hypothetical protein